MTTIVLLRHGETDRNRDRRIQGWAGTPLNELGRGQARAAGEYLAEAYDIERLLTSDLQRTRETADLVRDAGDLPNPEPGEGWRERGFGTYEGMLYDEVFDQHPEHDAETGIVTLDAKPPEGESLRGMIERVVGAWEELLVEAGDDETVVVVTHGGPIYVVTGHVRGQDVVTAIAGGSQDNCALTELEHDPASGAVDIVSENARPHLGSDLRRE